MAGKGGKGLLAAKTTAANKDKDKKKPISRSARAGLQVMPVDTFLLLFALFYIYSSCPSAREFTLLFLFAPFLFFFYKRALLFDTDLND